MPNFYLRYKELDRHTKGERPRIVSTSTKKNYLPAIFYLGKKVALVRKDYYCSISRTITFTLLMHSSSFALPFQLFLHCLRLPLKMRRDSHLVVILELPSFNACLSIRFFEKAVPLKGIGIWTWNTHLVDTLILLHRFCCPEIIEFL